MESHGNYKAASSVALPGRTGIPESPAAIIWERQLQKKKRLSIEN